MAIEKQGDVSDAAVSKFERLVGSVKTPLTFVEGSISNAHRLLDSGRVRDKHDGFLSGEKSFPGRLAYHSTAVPKRPSGTVNKFQMLSDDASCAG
jgi:hypothetical protein